MNMHSNGRSHRGFTLIEGGLALCGFLLLLSLVLIIVNQEVSFRRDVTRSANMNQLSKALALYAADKQVYPSAKLCIDGKDAVIQELVATKYFDPGVKIADPRWPDDPAFCYLYDGSGSTFTLKYFLETDRSGPKGYNYIRP